MMMKIVNGEPRWFYPDPPMWRDFDAEALRRKEEAERQAARLQARQREYSRALNAATLRGCEITPTVRQLQQHVVDLALAEPPISIEWLRAARSTELVGAGNGVAVHNSRLVVVHPIVDLSTAITVLHEIGHHRTPRFEKPLMRECAAWRWAREHAPAWTEATQRLMVAALRSYTNAADLKDIVDVLEVERCCSHREYAGERQRRLEIEIKNERARAAAFLKDRQCERCRRAPATVVYGGGAYCAECPQQVQEELRQRAIDTEIARQRRQYMRQSLKLECL